jgi:hypothetical protein
MNSPPNDSANGSGAVFDSSDSDLIIWDGPWDLTVYPFPPNLPRWYPGREPPPGLYREISNERPPQREGK